MPEDEILIDHSQTAEEHSLHIDHAKPQSHGKTPETPTKIPPMQTVVQVTVYREMGDHFEYLLLKRIDEDDKFWQVVTEPVAASSTIADTVRNAATEQIGIHGFKQLSHEMHSYEWYTSGERGRDIIFAAELEPQTMISPDRGRFSEYAWLKADEAIRRLKWNGNKEALRQLDHNLVTDRRAHPLPPTTGLYPGVYSGKATADAADLQAAQRAHLAANPPNPYGPGLPRRLPDAPANGPPTDIDGLPLASAEDANTSALFL